MSSDTDSSSRSDSSIDYKKRKSSKKHKKEKKLKKQKKKKYHKEKKYEKLDLDVKPLISSVQTENEVDAFGPALPPHLQQKSTNQTESPAIIGPVLPAGFSNSKAMEISNPEAPQSLEENNDSDDDMGFGPLPIDNNAMTTTEIEREQRALELKIAVMEGRDLNNKSDQKSREEWMLELPDVGLRGGLASLSNMKRTFYAGKEKPDFSDRSAWTKTPQGEIAGQQPTSSKTSAESLRNQAEAKYARERDAEQEQLAKKHKKKHKREESLVELHQKKLKKEKKQKEKELAEKGEKPERRPFSRDVDLKLNKIDSNQTKQIVDKAKILNTKFSSGRTKYL